MGLRMCSVSVAVCITLIARAHVAPGHELALFLLGHRIGVERYSIDAADPARSVLSSHFEYLDRGTTIALDTTLTFSSKDFTPVSFESHGKSYRYFSVDASVPAFADTTAGKPGGPTFT